jgi:ABC-type phosphate transport system permease subunit
MIQFSGDAVNDDDVRGSDPSATIGRGASMSEFVEVQRFRQRWVILLLSTVTAIVVGVFGYGIVLQLVIGRPFGDRPMTNTGLVAATVAAVAIVGAVVNVTASGVRIHFRPLTSRMIERRKT